MKYWNLNKVSLLASILFLLSSVGIVQAAPLSSTLPNFQWYQEGSAGPYNSDFTVNPLAAGPTITVWYDGTYNFGSIGIPQTQINILGKVSSGVKSLTYRLNGGASTALTVGPDTRRLANSGDFNIAIDVSALQNGTNKVVITAVDNSNLSTSKTVSFTYQNGSTWPMPYFIHWDQTSSIQSASQVVDGLWQLTSGGVRTVEGETGYDRLIAIGDRNTWKDYDILVPITVHQWFDDPNTVYADGGVGIISRWQGHDGTNNPPDEWWHIGAYGYYRLYDQKPDIFINRSTRYKASELMTFNLNQTYFFKLRTKSSGTDAATYNLKVWPKGQSEPASWIAFNATTTTTEVLDSSEEMGSGSILLVAHYADATFGDVSICPISDGFTLTPQVNGAGTITIPSNQQKSSYQCGDMATLTANPSPGWVFSGWTLGSGQKWMDPVLKVQMGGDQIIMANFSPAGDPLPTQTPVQPTPTQPPIQPNLNNHLFLPSISH